MQTNFEHLQVNQKTKLEQDPKSSNIGQLECFICLQVKLFLR